MGRSMICEKCKKRPAHLILEIVEDDPSKDDEMYFEGLDEDENDNLIERTMRVCRSCAQEIQKSMLGGVTLIRNIGRGK